MKSTNQEFTNYIYLQIINEALRIVKKKWEDSLGDYKIEYNDVEKHQLLSRIIDRTGVSINDMKKKIFNAIKEVVNKLDNKEITQKSMLEFNFTKSLFKLLIMVNPENKYIRISSVLGKDMSTKNTIPFKIDESFLIEELSFKEIKDKYKDDFSKINVYEYDDKISIDLIIAKEKNQGKGTALMTDICEYADNTNKTIVLSPSSEFGGNKRKLIDFYKRFDFVENKGKNKIFGIFESMYRLPK